MSLVLPVLDALNKMFRFNSVFIGYGLKTSWGFHPGSFFRLVHNRKSVKTERDTYWRCFSAQVLLFFFFDYTKRGSIVSSQGF